MAPTTKKLSGSPTSQRTNCATLGIEPLALGLQILTFNPCTISKALLVIFVCCCGCAFSNTVKHFPFIWVCAHAFASMFRDQKTPSHRSNPILTQGSRTHSFRAMQAVIAIPALELQTCNRTLGLSPACWGLSSHARMTSTLLIN